RKVGETEWIYRPDLVITAASNSAVRRGIRWDVYTDPGQYEVAIRRLSADTPDPRWVTDSTWTALRSINSTYPIDFPFPLALTALRIKATDQLNGVITDFNGVASSILPDWDAATQTWIERVTGNPAAAYRHVLQGAPSARPLPDFRVDVAMLQEWHEFCQDKGFEINHIFDSRMSMEQALKTIAACGRATPTVVSGNSKWSVIVDEPQTVPTQHFSPVNTWDFSAQIKYPDLPHAFRCPFINAAGDFKADERIVYNDPYTQETASKFETLELAGVTDKDQIFRMGRYHLAQGKLRREEYTFYCDLEHLRCLRGDLIRVSSDVTLWGGDSARIKEVLLQEGTGYPVGLRLTMPVRAAFGELYNVRLRTALGASLLVNLAEIIPGPGFFEEELFGEYGWLGGGIAAEETDEIMFTAPLTSPPYPEPGDLVLFGLRSMESRELLVTGIFPRHDLSARIMAVDYDPAVYTADTEEIPPFNSLISPLPEWATPIISTMISDGTVLVQDTNGNWQSQLLVIFKPIPTEAINITGIEVAWRIRGTQENWQTAITRTFQAFCAPVQSGSEYEVRARYIKADGRQGPWCSLAYHTVQGKEWPPSNVTGFNLSQSQAVMNFWWNAAPDRDLRGYELRYGPLDSTWEDAEVITTVMSGTSFACSTIPAGTWKFMVKALDTSGNYSADYAYRNYNVANFYRVLVEAQQWPDWPGTRTNLVRNPLTGHLNPDDQAGADGNNFSVFDQVLQTPYESMSYEAPEIDLGEDQAVRVWSQVAKEQVPGYPDAEPAFQIDYHLEAGAYDGFEDWGIGPLSARYIKGRIVMDDPARLNDFALVVDKEL
ncbi:MAG: phage tail protein, partial [Candidatus Thermoplasmatota archaeon]|nr:phage tail protein [Candidatus Thermoplasmatota archaeon]